MFSNRTEKTKSLQADKTEAENVMREHASKRTKLSMMFTAIQELRDMQNLIGTIANMLVLLQFYFEFLLTGVDTRPSMATYVMSLANVITLKNHVTGSSTPMITNQK